MRARWAGDRDVMEGGENMQEECWKLSTADIADAPTWFRRLMQMGLVDLFEVGGSKCFWAVATDCGRVIAYNGDYVTEDRRVVVKQDAEFGGWEVRI